MAGSQSRSFLNLSNSAGVQVGGWVLIAWRASWYFLCRPACSSIGYQLRWPRAAAGQDSAVAPNLLRFSTSLRTLPTAGCTENEERGVKAVVNKQFEVENFVLFAAKRDLFPQLTAARGCRWDLFMFLAVREPLLCSWTFHFTFSAQ